MCLCREVATDGQGVMTGQRGLLPNSPGTAWQLPPGTPRRRPREQQRQQDVDWRRARSSASWSTPGPLHPVQVQSQFPASDVSVTCVITIGKNVSHPSLVARAPLCQACPAQLLRVMRLSTAVLSQTQRATGKAPCSIMYVEFGIAPATWSLSTVTTCRTHRSTSSGACGP